MKIFNVLSRSKEDFAPLDARNVNMYACGITASGEAHIGHAYQALIFDVIRSYLEYSGYKVNYVRNYTDVDDKILVNAKKAGVEPLEFANKIMDSIDSDFKKLGIEPPAVQSKATECIIEMIEFIKALIDKGYAYATDSGDVYFEVDKFEHYGRFSNRLEAENLMGGVRKEIEPGKKNDRDFALWKNAGRDSLFWDSPWGRGRPGWHIECSAMSQKYLGDTLDIHGGGKDLIFPHHENEIAQSEARTGKLFAKYWIHNGLIKVNGQKMSKSLNNSIFLKDLLNEFNPDVIKFTILQNSYRSDLNIMTDTFLVNEDKIYEIYKLFEKIDVMCAGVIPDENNELSKKIEREFKSAMDNDFNTALVTANLMGYITELNKAAAKKDADKRILAGVKATLVRVYGVIRLLQINPAEAVAAVREKYLSKAGLTKDGLNIKLKAWQGHRENKDFASADKIRDELLEKGISITPAAGWEINFKAVK